MLDNKTEHGTLLGRFYSGNLYLLICVAVSALGVVFNCEIEAAVILILLLAGQLFTLRDCGRMFYPVLLLVTVLVNLTGADITRGAWLVVGAVPVFSGMAYNIIKHKKRFRANGVFLPMLAVSLAVTAGGVFSIPGKDYFEIGNLFYVFFLGFGMTALCALIYTLLDGDDGQNMQREFVRAVSDSGIFLAAVIIFYYLVNLAEFAADHQTIDDLAHNPMRNVAVAYFMLSMPFVFYRAKTNLLYLPGGVVMYLACLLSGSRMGLVFGSVMLLVCAVYFIITSRRYRWIVAGALGIVIVAVFIARDEIMHFYIERLREDFGTENFINPNESRILLMRRSVEDFFSSPIFGRGLGYTGNEDLYAPRLFEMNWYHNFLCQIIGSLGVVGIAAYMYQLYYRLELLFKRATSFSWLIFLMYGGVLLSGITDTGIFTPFPTVFLLNCAFMIVAKTKNETCKEQNVA